MRYTHDQMTEIASALRDGFEGRAIVTWRGWNTIVCKIDGLDEPLIVQRTKGVTWPEGIAPEVVAGVDLDIRTIVSGEPKP